MPETIQTQRAASPDSVAVWRPSALLRFEVRHAISTKPTCARHAHETFCVMLTERGRASLHVGGRALELTSGDLIVLHPGQIHHGGAAGGGVLEYRSIYPDASLVEEAARRASVIAPPAFRAEPIRDARVASLLRTASAPFEPSTSAAERESLLLEALSRLIERHGSDGDPPATVSRREIDLVKRHIEAHLAERITLCDLGRVVDLSPSYLGRLFREDVGVSPHEYQIHRRVVRATELLEDGVPVADAATAVGFFDQAHFHRHFSKIMRITPGRWGVPPAE